ncbi:lysophospholipase L1-like esterase [Chryseomicrobium aureum]|uniref:SGNH/GDSL hydrolase family protein n=1 Tax=Chryseomicrobium aureum TaxID=1441723 RepID=UPI00195D6A64|nr:SGNH/GDSL hydrolase family protein [Chryseomicrobium aureum]MBM7707389.1 lysophospholipase L1-like esterase [Chryseomicrobium aureum]
MKKWIVSIVSVLVLSVSLPAFASAQTIYVALGDSIAAGQTPNREIDQGYTDLIAAELARNGQLLAFSKDLAFPGFTTEQVRESIQSDEAQELLASATLITISAGANDLLRIVTANPELGTLSYQQQQANFALNQARKSLEGLLQDLETVAPNAEVYVVGYYFAYPHVAEFQKQGTAKELNRLNQILEQTAQANGATFVSVEDRMNTDLKSFVPNPADVHPTQEGYRQIANSFFDTVNPNLTVSPFEMPQPNPLSFEEIQAAQEQQSEEESVDQARAHTPHGLALAEIIPYI